mgnify:CR=1 FL=1
MGPNICRACSPAPLRPLACPTSAASAPRRRPRLRSAHHRALCHSPACRRPFPPRPQRPSTFELQSAPRSPAQWCTMWPACRTSLSTVSRITPFIRTRASHLHEAAALRPERFWSAEKTNAGESKLRSLSQALAALRELVRAEHRGAGA